MEPTTPKPEDNPGSQPQELTNQPPSAPAPVPEPLSAPDASVPPAPQPEISAETTPEPTPASPAPAVTEPTVSASPVMPEVIAPTVISPTTGSTPAPAVTELISPAVPSAQPATPTQEHTGPVVNGQAIVPPAGPVGMPKPKGKKPKWLLPVAIAALVIVLGGGYVFGFYLPSRPGTVYSSSLKNTGKAVDKLISYSNDQANKKYKSVAFDGTVSVKSESGSGDGTITGSFGTDGSGTASLDVDAMGVKAKLNVISVHVASSTTPDLYVQATGIKSYLDSNGLSTLDNLDGQWISIDHTLLNTYTQAVQSDGSGTSAPAPTAAQVNDLAQKVQTVNKQYIFTASKDKAVLTKQSYVGKETKDGRSVYHYKVGYSKANLKAYVAALKTAADSSTLNDWSKKAYDKSISDQLNLKDAAAAIDKQPGNYTFDMYADVKTKLVHSIALTDTTDKSSVVTIAQNFTGGDVYPFSIVVTGKDDAGKTDTATVNLSINSKTNKVAFSLDGNQADGGTTYTAKFNASPSDKAVTATAPASSKSINELLSQFGLGGTSAVSNNLPLSSSPVSDLLTFVQ